MELVVCQEQYGSHPISRKYIRTEWGSVRTVDQTRRFTSIPQFFRTVFLPQGYPDSVSEDYLQYQIWDTIQAFCSSITNTLATQAVLKGVGVGDESATILAATITWILKNGTGMAGQIIFAWKKSSSLDSDCKRWRLFADILNDAAICIEIIAPFFKEYFTGIICVAGLMKAIVGCAGGATRAALTQHQARRNNMADVSAKDGSQETLVNLAALLVSLLLIPTVTGNHVLIWTLYFIFTSMHLFANYKAVACVTMETFNMTRLHIVVQRYLEGDQYVMTVKEANQLEPVIFSPRRYLTMHNGVSAEFLSTNAVDVDKLLTLFKNLNYLVNFDLKTGDVYIVLHSGADSFDQLRACFHAEVLDYAVQASNTGAVCAEPIKTLVEAVSKYDTLTVMSKSFEITQKLFTDFLGHASQRGWNTKIVQLGADEWRANWSVYGISEKKYY